MRIAIENVDYSSASGPNHFGRKLSKYLELAGHSLESNEPDVQLSFIESHMRISKEVPLIQRLDGIYFNTDFNYEDQNNNIRRTYNDASGVIFQVEFAKDLVFSRFGEKEKFTVIPNGADISAIKNVDPMSAPYFDKYEDIWLCASSWRPHKRLTENIKYFLEHASDKTALLIAGDTWPATSHPRVHYLGNIDIQILYSLYNRASTFLHLAWLDYCPNVVVDARAAGCKIICSSSGGTREIAGPSAVVIKEDGWDFQPTKLYSPPSLNFAITENNEMFNSEYDMIEVADRYVNFLKESV